jgi:hypothetical protein
MDQIFDIIQWVATAVVVPAMAWLVHKQVRKAKGKSEIESVYKRMYESVSETLLQLHYENKGLQEKKRQLEISLSRAVMCKYYDDCPVVRELQKREADNQVLGNLAGCANRQRKPGGRADHEGDPDTGIEGDDETVV